MKNNFIIILISLLYFQTIHAENLKIRSEDISIDKKTKITIFKNNVEAIDDKNNTLITNYAEYEKNLNILKSKDKTKIITSEGYILEGNNIIFDNNKNIINSNEPATIIDLAENIIYLDKFEYSTSQKFFKSTGKIKVVDINKNSYNFSQIFIDEKKREIIGTDIKAFLNQESFKLDPRNKPRVFANTIKIDNEISQFNKSKFTFCDYRKNDKCPPWSIQASQMIHDQKKKTIFYDNAVIKIYDIPVFYTPKFSHPDPTVDRRTGFLAPSFTNSKNLGGGLSIPYYWDLNKDKDLMVTSKLFNKENPLFLSEYRQAFEESNIILDFGYTEGYKNTDKKKLSGEKSHFFSSFVKNFKGKNNSDNNFEFTAQNVSNDKYLKLYKVDSNLADYQTDTLKNSINFTHTNDDLFFGVEASMFETLKEEYNDKYEYILPDIIIDKNLFNNDFGVADVRSNLKIHNFDTNKTTQFLVNDVDWKYKESNFSNGLSSQFLGKIKNVNYDAKNTSEYKNDTTNELFGALGYLTKVNFSKSMSQNSNQFLTPKILFRYAPGHMRKEVNKTRLTHNKIFSLDRLNSYNNLESGLSATIGFDYEIENPKNELNFSIGQIINENDNNDMPSSSSLDEKLSDVIGHADYSINKKIKLNYNFAVDQNYNTLNYNEVGTEFDFNPIKFNFNYLKEQEHIGDQEYLKSSINIAKGQDGIFSASTKRNLITNSAEYYNLSYEYINDCLKAGLFYRREFYNDSELEAENSLMFKITLIPFSNANSN